MSLLKAYLLKASTRTTLSRKPGEKGFSLIELVVVIAVLAVLTAIALPNFLGVSEDASARTAQQAALNAYKECKVFWARNKRDTGRAFNTPAITDWVIVAQESDTTAGEGFGTADGNRNTAQASVDMKCFEASEAERDIFAVPKDIAKFPIYKINVAGDRRCKNGSDDSTETYDIGCSGSGAGGLGDWE